MYLKPRQIFQRFLVEAKETRIDETGRQRVEFKPTGLEIFGVLCTIEPFEREKLFGLKREADCKIVQKNGGIRAQVGDKLISGNRKFLVKAVETPAGLGYWQIYYATERSDL